MIVRGRVLPKLLQNLTFHVEHHKHEAEIQLDPLGIITLSWFRARLDQDTRAPGRAANKQEDAS